MLTTRFLAFEINEPDKSTVDLLLYWKTLSAIVKF